MSAFLRSWLVRGPLAFVLLGVAGVGSALRPLSRHLEVEIWGPSMSGRASQNTSRSAALQALFGGFASAIADLLWIRAAVACEKSDEIQAVRSIRGAVACEARSLYFWLNGARIIAYDVAAWRLERLHSSGMSSPALRAMIVAEQTREALALLGEAEAMHPETYLVPVEAGQIYLHARNDLNEAASCFGRAMNCRDAPRFVGRIHAELLRRSGRLTEAHQSLVFQLRKVRETGTTRTVDGERFNASFQASTDWTESDAGAEQILVARIREIEQEM